MEATTTETKQLSFSITVTNTKQVSMPEALKYYQFIYNPEEKDEKTQDLVNIIQELNEAIEQKKTTSGDMMKKMAALIRELPRENIATMVAMLIEVLATHSEETDYQELRQSFQQKVAELPSNQLPSIETVQSVMPKSLEPTHIPSYYYRFEDWRKMISDEEREKLLNLEPCEAINYYQMDPRTTLQRLSMPKENYRKSECMYRLVPCLNGAYCLYSHHPLTREWIDSHWDEFIDYLKNFDQK